MTGRGLSQNSMVLSREYGYILYGDYMGIEFPNSLLSANKKKLSYGGDFGSILQRVSRGSLPLGFRVEGLGFTS